MPLATRHRDAPPVALDPIYGLHRAFEACRCVYQRPEWSCAA
jgi:hypothetical protein